jgi:NAD-dependent protein deacetylase/lipoamidase
VIQLHGTIRIGDCLGCHRSWDSSEVEERLEASEDGVPRCDCGGTIKPAVTLFGEHLPVLALQQAIGHANDADYALCLGSSLQVMPAAAIPQLVLSNGGRVAIINRGTTAYDGQEGVTKVDAPLGEALPIILEVVDAAPGARLT